MALFGKKSDATDASTSASKAGAGGKSRGLSFGRKKAADTTPTTPDTTGLQMPGSGDGFEDFSDFTDTSATAGTATVKTKEKPAKTARPRVINGTTVGLNIGNDSIKAVELQAKGGEVTVTAMGMIPTPAESISNGVVMSVSALQFAIRDLLKSAGIKSKSVIVSVAGTGALVVRVIEVPRMSDVDLAKNMQIDADRYIPFPPSEVIMDFKALRELPSDPDSANMDVLLAAAQREIIDLHIKVLEEAKLTPRAIEVEPLAVARALTQNVTKQAQALEAESRNGHGLAPDEIDYSRVTAIINIGAAGTEISVLRGDILVFTRTVPNGGNTLTQSLVDYLGLPWHDAERVKQEWADALPPQQAAAAAPAGFGAAPAATDDWNEFGNDFGNDFGSFDDPAAGSQAVSGGTSDATQVADPFDPDYFNQGPQGGTAQEEPREQHGQKDPEDEKAPPAFDFSAFSFADDVGQTSLQKPSQTPQSASSTPDEVDEPAPFTIPVAETPVAETPAVEAAPDAGLSFGFSDEPVAAAAVEPAPAVEPADAADNFSFDLSDAPVPTAPPAGTGSTFDFGNLGLADEPAPAGAAPGGEAGVSSSTPFDLSKSPKPAAEPSTVPAATETTSAVSSTPSAWNLEDLGITDPAPATAATPDVATTGFSDFDTADIASGSTATAGTGDVAAGASDFDLDSFFNTPGDAGGVGGAPASDFDIAAIGAAGTASAAGLHGGELGTEDFGAGDFGAGFGDDFANFGAGLTTGLATGVDAATVYSILHPLLEELANEIRRSLEYHASRYPDAVVQEIVLVGGGARMKNIDQYLSQALGMSVQVGNPLQRLALNAPQLPQGYMEQNAPTFAVAIGLGLRDLIG